MANRAGTGTDLSPEEVQRRVAILKRFREMLSKQRDRFRDYLDVLDKQKDTIVAGDTDKLVAQVEIEEAIVSDIFAIQKVIDPLENLYREARGGAEGEIPDLKANLEELKTEVAARSERNRSLLKAHMEELRTEIQKLRNNPFAQRRSVYADAGGGSVIDVEG